MIRRFKLHAVLLGRSADRCHRPFEPGCYARGGDSRIGKSLKLFYVVRRPCWHQVLHVSRSVQHRRPKYNLGAFADVALKCHPVVATEQFDGLNANKPHVQAALEAGGPLSNRGERVVSGFLCRATD